MSRVAGCQWQSVDQFVFKQVHGHGVGDEARHAGLAADPALAYVDVEQPVQRHVNEARTRRQRLGESLDRSVRGFRAQRGVGVFGRPDDRKPIVRCDERARQVEPIGLSENACCGNRVVIGSAVRAVWRGSRAVVVGECAGDSPLIHSCSAASPVAECLDVHLTETGRHSTASRARLPSCVVVEPIEPGDDIRVSGETLFGTVRSGGWTGCELGEACLGGRPGVLQSGVESLLHPGLGLGAGLLVPVGDRADADAEMRGEGVIAHLQRGLKRARGLACPAHRIHRSRAPKN